MAYDPLIRSLDLSCTNASAGRTPSIFRQRPKWFRLSDTKTRTPTLVASVSNVDIDPVISKGTAAFFELLGLIPTNSHIAQAPATSATTRVTLRATCDSSVQLKGPLDVLSGSNPSERLSVQVRETIGSR